MIRNKWMGKKFHQWIETIIISKKGLDWWAEHKPADFVVLQSYAQELLFKCSEYEYTIANKIRSYGIPVELQVVYLNRFIADIALMEAKVIIELDGKYHDIPRQTEKDKERDELFRLFGFTVIRWKLPMSEQDLEQKIQYFVRAYKRFNRGYKLRPLVRPGSIEKITAAGLVQKALMLKKRKKNG